MKGGQAMKEKKSTCSHQLMVTLNEFKSIVDDADMKVATLCGIGYQYEVYAGADSGTYVVLLLGYGTGRGKHRVYIWDHDGTSKENARVWLVMMQELNEQIAADIAAN